jgi:hypothetical protein
LESNHSKHQLEDCTAAITVISEGVIAYSKFKLSNVFQIQLNTALPGNKQYGSVTEADSMANRVIRKSETEQKIT